MTIFDTDRPKGQTASPSLYDYANGDPVNDLDPDGRQSFDADNNPAILGSNGSISANDQTIINFILGKGSLPSSGTPDAGLLSAIAGGPPVSFSPFDSSNPGDVLAVGLLTAPVNMFGGWALEGAYVAGEFGTGTVAVAKLAIAGGVFGSGVSVVTNTGTQLASNDYNLAAVDVTEQKVAFGVGGIFAVGSSLLTAGSGAIEQNAAGIISALNSEGANVESDLVAQGASRAVVNNATSGILNGINQTASLAATQTGVLAAADTFVSPVAQDRFEAKVLNIVQGLESKKGTPSR